MAESQRFLDGSWVAGVNDYLISESVNAKISEAHIFYLIAFTFHLSRSICTLFQLSISLLVVKAQIIRLKLKLFKIL